MKNLIAITYRVRARAEEVLTTLRLSLYHCIADLQDVAFITSDQQGRIHIHYQLYAEDNALSPLSSNTWLSLITLLRGAFDKRMQGPGSSLENSSVIECFADHLSMLLGANCSVIVILVNYSMCEKLLPQLSAFGGIVSQMMISPSLENQLQVVHEKHLALHMN